MSTLDREALREYLIDLALDCCEELRTLAADSGVRFTYADALQRMYDRLHPSLKQLFSDADDFMGTAAPMMETIAVDVYGGGQA